MKEWVDRPEVVEGWSKGESSVVVFTSFSYSHLHVRLLLVTCAWIQRYHDDDDDDLESLLKVRTHLGKWICSGQVAPPKMYG